MSSDLRERIGDVKRFRQIVIELWNAGFDAVLDDLQLKKLLPASARFRRLMTPQKKAHLEKPPHIRIRETMERLGPTFVKFGQMLSLRADLVGEVYAKEFSKLQRAVPPFSGADAERVIREEFGKPVEQVFKNFDPKPFAAASLAQVHRATLRNGTRVAVKVQRPSVRVTVENDIHILLFLAALAERYVPALRKIRPVRVVKEFAEWTLRELDFTIEGGHIDRFRANLEGEERMRIPAVYWEYTSRRVLTMELLSGIPFEETSRLRKAKVDLEVIADTAIRTMLKQFFIDGFFHGDPHPGNFVVLPGNVIGMLDFGIVGRLSAEVRLELISVFISYNNKDSEGYAKHLLDLAELGTDADTRAFRSEVSRILDRVIYSPLKQKGIADAFYQVVTRGAQHDVFFPLDLVLLGKALLTVESVALKLYPRFDFDAAVGPYLSEVIRAELSPKKLAAQAQGNAFDALALLRTLPEHTLSLLKKIESGNLQVKLDFTELRDLKREFDRQNDVRVLALVVVALFLGSGAILRFEGFTLFGVSLGRIGLVASFLLLLWLVYHIGKKPK